jgi:hypothetical protein
MDNRSVGNRRSAAQSENIALAPEAEAIRLIPILLTATIASLALIQVPGLLVAILLVTVVLVTKRCFAAGGKS